MPGQAGGFAFQPGESVLRRGRANLQRGAETVGGSALLTDRRLVFTSHAMNVNTGTTEIPVRDITGTRKVWTKLFGVIPLAPNSLLVSTVTGESFAFVLNGRAAWQDAIARAVAAHR